MSKVYDVPEGKKSIEWMYSTYGLPQLVIEKATIEVATGKCKNPTIVVDRVVGMKLRFPNGVRINDVPKTLKRLLDYSGIVTEKVRHPNNHPEKMPRATKKEMSGI